jgi:hypothetical protein
MGAAVHDRVIAHSPCVKIALPPVEDAEVAPPSADTVAGARRGRAEPVPGLGGAPGWLRAADRRGARARGFGRRLLAPDGACRAAAPAGRHARADEDSQEHAHRAARPGRCRRASATPGSAPKRRSVLHRRARTTADVPDMEEDLADSDDPGRRECRHAWPTALHGLRPDLWRASVKQVQTVLGHSSAAITLRVYAHLWPGDDDRTRSVMDSALAVLEDQVRTEKVV